MTLLHWRAPRPARRRPDRRRRTLTAVAGLAVIAASTLVSSGAEAVAFGPYDIDGNVPGADAAQTLSDPSGSVKELGPKNASSTKIGVIHTAATPMLDFTNPNAQVDLKTAWLNLKRVSNKDWVYFGWERDSNTGSGFIAFEFMKNGLPSGCSYDASTDAQLIANCNPWRTATEAGGKQVGRSAGDFLLLWDQSGSSAVFYKRVWTQASANAPLVLAAPVLLDSSTEAKGVYSADGTRGEASVNLTAAGLTNGTSCTTFANVIPSTVTGNSDTADYKDTILKRIDPLSSCQATTVTTPKDGNGNNIPAGGLSIGTGSVEVKDSSVVSLGGGTATPTGTVSFRLCKVDAPAVCGVGDGTAIGSTALSGANYPATVVSPSAWVTSAGRYCWRSTWSGDAANSIPSATETPAAALNECFVVNPVTATLSTTASAGGVLGSTLTDSATLGGVATAPMNPIIRTSAPPVAPAAGAPAPGGGSIVFKLYGPDDCSTVAYTSTAVSVSGNGSYSSPAGQFTPTAIGAYHWKAAFTSTSPNTLGTSHNSDCSDTNEDATITDVVSTMTTAQSWVPNDTATIGAAAGGDLNGTVTFEFFDNGSCTGEPLWTEGVAVDGPSEQTVGTSNEEAIDASGEFSWQVSYDSDNPAQRDIAATCDEVSSLTIDNDDTTP